MKTLLECANIAAKDQIAPFRACLDCGSFYIFNFSNPNAMTGSEFPAVNKTTGKLTYFNVASNPQIFLKAKDVTKELIRLVKGAKHG